jgi:hypothetical protein
MAETGQADCDICFASGHPPGEPLDAGKIAGGFSDK